MTAVLIIGWLIQSLLSEDSLHSALITQNRLYDTIGHFTPRELFTSYASTIGLMTHDLLFGYHPTSTFAEAGEHAIATLGGLLLDLALAVPRTVDILYQATSGTAALVVLAGFGMAVGTVFVTLLGPRTTLARILLALALSPLVASLLFLTLQGFMLLMLDVFFWFTTLAPYTVACPVLCTFYWMAFPNAEQGATASIAYAVLRMAEPVR